MASVATPPTSRPVTANGCVTPVPTTKLSPPSVVFAPTELHISVSGVGAFYTASLSSAPDNSVTVSSKNVPTCIRITPSLAIFTKDNWNKPQTFRVAALLANSDEKDEKKSHVIEHTSDSADISFDANNLLFVPTRITIHIAPREGRYGFTAGKTLAKATTETSVQNSNLLVTELEVDKTFAITPGNAIPTIASAFDGMSPRESYRNSARRLQWFGRSSSRKGVTGSSNGLNGGGTSLAQQPPQALSAAATLSKEPQGFALVSSRGNQSILLTKTGALLTLGRMEIDWEAGNPLELDLQKSMGNSGAITGSSSGSGSSSPAKYANNSLSRSPVRMTSSINIDVPSTTVSWLFTDVECGNDHAVAINEHGYLLSWGEGKDGRLGHGNEQSLRQAKLIRSLHHKRVIQVACGERHSMALCEDGDVFTWGYGKSGALGHGNSTVEMLESVEMPMEVLSLRHLGVVKIACGDMHSVVMTVNGQVLTAGWGNHGRLGRPCQELSSCFERIDLKQKRCVFVACGGAHTLVLLEDSTMMSFGNNAHGELGVGDCQDRSVPTAITYFDGSFPIICIAAGRFHSLALLEDFRVFAWGSDELGQCGLNSYAQIYTIPHFVRATFGYQVTQISAGMAHSVFLALSSQKQLETMEHQHPSRYSAFVDRYERFVEQDLARRERVLNQLQKQKVREQMVQRQRIPKHVVFKKELHDASINSLAKALKVHLTQIDHERAVANATMDKAKETAASASILPGTVSVPAATSSATILSTTSTSPVTTATTPTGIDPVVLDKVFSGDGGIGLATPLKEEKRKKTVRAIRCSSASLWRQTRLFSFVKPSDDQKENRPQRPQTAQAAHLSRGIRKASQRQALAASATATATATATNTATNSNISSNSNDDRHPPHDSSKAEDLTLDLFPASRPKSAPCCKTKGPNV